MLQGMETKPAPDHAGTDSGTDDEAKLQSVAEREPGSHRKRNAAAPSLRPAAAEGGSEAAEAAAAQRRPHRAASNSGGKSCLPCVEPFTQLSLSRAHLLPCSQD